MLRRQSRIGATYGRELVSNPGPFVNTNGWNAPGLGSLAATNGELVITYPAAASFPSASTSVTTEAGRYYRVTLTARRGTSTDPIGANLAGFDPGFNANITSGQTNVSLSFIFKATGATANLLIFASSGSSVAGTEILVSLSVKQILL